MSGVAAADVPLDDDDEGSLGFQPSWGSVIEVCADWRRVAIRYGDTEELLVELNATTEEGQIRVDLTGDLLFDFDSTAIRPDAEVVLSKVAQVIRDRAVGQVTVIGHTDSIGRDTRNQKLSEARSVAVMRWLNRNQGIPTSLMVGRGMGSKKPVASNAFAEGRYFPGGRAQTRRVEIQITTRGYPGLFIRCPALRLWKRFHRVPSASFAPHCGWPDLAHTLAARDGIG